MDRMKTFLIYALAIIGFFVLSILLENGLLSAMYSKIQGEFGGEYTSLNQSFSMENMEAKACNINGYMSFDLVNLGQRSIHQCFLKIDLYNEVDLLADTDYVEVLDMEPGETRHFQIKFKANNIERYQISVVPTAPDRSNIIDILGWEVDLTNVFGLGIDVTNISIFGTRLGDLFTVENMKTAGSNAWNWITVFLGSIPWWGYAIAGGIILWHMPMFYFL